MVGRTEANAAAGAMCMLCSVATPSRPILYRLRRDQSMSTMRSVEGHSRPFLYAMWVGFGGLAARTETGGRRHVLLFLGLIPRVCAPRGSLCSKTSVYRFRFTPPCRPAAGRMWRGIARGLCFAAQRAYHAASARFSLLPRASAHRDSVAWNTAHGVASSRLVGLFGLLPR